MSLAATLHFVNILFAGIVAGGLMLMLVAVAPARKMLPAEQAAMIHHEMSRRIDWYMPASVAGSAAAGLLSLLWRRTGMGYTSATLLIIGICLTGGVAASSLGALLPINRQVATWLTTGIPDCYADVFRRWGMLHKVRTACGVLALVAYLLATFTAPFVAR